MDRQRQPVRGGGKVGAHARDYATCIEDYVKATGGRKDKLLLGIAVDHGGVEWNSKTDQPRSPIVGRSRKLTAQEARENAEKHGRKFDPEQKAPWYCYAKDGQWVQGWYEDEQSLAEKLKLAREQGLQGVCLWVLDGAAEPPSTFELIHKKPPRQVGRQGCSSATTTRRSRSVHATTSFRRNLTVSER